MDGLDLTLVDSKGMLVASWLMSLSYGILLLQICLYVRSRAADPILLKLAVGVLFLVDTTWNILLLVSTFHQLITVSPTSLDIYVPPLTFVCMPLLGACSLFGVNLFLVWRYSTLTKKTWLGYGLYSISCATFVCYIYSILLSIKLRDFDLTDMQKYIADYKMADKVSKAGMSLEVVMVCTIWILLFVALFGYLQKEMLGTRRIVIRLLLITAESGTAASVICVAQLIYFLNNPTSSNAIIIAMFTARVYYMGMMFTLNMRGSGGQIMKDAFTGQQSGIYGASNSLPLSHIRSSGGVPSHLHKVIHVSRDIATDSDKEQGVFRLADDKL